MAEELRFAMRCHGSRQRPALRRSCARCSPASTYVPAALDLPHLNGVSIDQIPVFGNFIEMKKYRGTSRRNRSNRF